MTKETSVFAGKRCLITGASGGIGRAVAAYLGSRGSDLVLTARDQGRLESMKDEIASLNRDILIEAIAADLNDIESINSLVKTINSNPKPVSILINNAGVFPVAPFGDFSVEEYENCFNINVRAAFLLCSELIPAMVDQKWGRIVNIGSSSAYSGFANTSIYCASKHALLGMSRSLHSEYKKNGVRVFCLSPGSVQTEMGKQVIGQDYETFIHPQEIADCIGFVVAMDGHAVIDEMRINRVLIQ